MSALPVLENPFAEKTDPIRLNAEAGSLPGLLRRAFAEGRAFGPDGQSIPLHSNVSFAEAQTLHQLVRQLKPAHTLEVGLAQGISALAILQALRDNASGIHHALDPLQDRFQNIGLAMVAQAGLTNYLDFHRKPPEEIIPTLPALQFVFIHSSHLFDRTLADFVLADKKLETGGMIALPDLWLPSLQKVVRYVLNSRSYKLVTLETQTRKALTSQQKFQKMLAELLRALPHSRRLFREELLIPWFTISTDNLLVLQKMEEDTRPWQFHQFL